VDWQFLGAAGDLATRGKESMKDVELWKGYADACQKDGTPAVVQLCHTGPQSPLGAGHRSTWASRMSPSAVPLNIGNTLIARLLRWLVFGTSREMTLDDIQRVMQMFVDAAVLMAESGFSGVELHGAHGYILSR
jgi:2,4-dienoyl-CoA reductase-like NADH-dependent reductase (Old Yellow Enzyme family)